MSHGLFYRCLCYTSGNGNIVVALLSLQCQKALGFHQNYITLCSEDERRSYGFGTTWSINDRIFILEWTIPLSTQRNFHLLVIYSFYNTTLANNQIEKLEIGIKSLSLLEPSGRNRPSRPPCTWWNVSSRTHLCVLQQQGRKHVWRMRLKKQKRAEELIAST